MTQVLMTQVNDSRKHQYHTGSSLISYKMSLNGEVVSHTR
jgi:hypothetical protein